MNFTENTIIVDNISKLYKIYGKPADRVREVLHFTRKPLYTDFHALRNVSFSLRRGEILGIMGCNGSGKSTLLKIIAGVLTPTYGTFEVRGRLSSLLELGAGFNMEYSGIENIYFYSTIMNMAKEEIDQKLPDIIQFAEIGDYINQPVKTYSSGMFARLAFSCAIHVDPEVLIVDEILSVGDIRFQAKCFNRFKDFKAQGMTIIYVGHDISIMRSFCDTCIWLNDGAIIEMGDPMAVSSKYIEFMYSGDLYNNVHAVSDVQSKPPEPQEGSPAGQKPADGVDTQFNNNNDDSEDVIDKQNNIAGNKPFANSLAHWGSVTGLIQSVEMLNEQGKPSDYFSSFERISIIISFKDDDKIDYDYLSTAFSIKNKNGMDIIVKTTFDEGIRINKEKNHRVCFSLATRLAVGDYYLVATLENRKNPITSYYEYIEGINYFTIVSEKKIFGVYDAKANIKYSVLSQ